jgi:hypothetical protein
MGQKARGIQVDNNSIKTGQDNLEIFLDVSGDLTKTSSGVKLNPALTQTYTFNTALPTSSLTPTLSTELTNKTYVDNLFAGIKWKPNVRAAAVTNLSLTGLQTVDGVSLSATNRILLTAQTTATENGIWVVAAGAWTRPTDFATGLSATSAFTAVDEGTMYADTIWRQTGDSIIIDTNNQTWNQLPIGSITAGTGISVSGFTVSLDIPGTANMGAVVNVADSLLMYDLSATTTVEATYQQILDGLHTTATVLTAPVNSDTMLLYDVSASSTVVTTLDNMIAGVINNATALSASPASNDVLLIGDTSASGAARKITISELAGAVGYALESHTLTAGEVTARSVTLTNAVTTTGKCYLVAFGGAVYSHAGAEVTFTAGAAGAATIAWATGTAGDGSLGGNLITGDKLLIFTV